MKPIKILGVLTVVFGLIFGISASAKLAGEPLTDDFNSFTAEENLLGVGKGYPKVAGGSAVFAHGGTYNYYGSSVIKPGAGPDGSTALVVGGTGAADISLMTIALDTSGSMVYEFSYDIKFNRLSTMSLAGNSMFGASKALFKLTSGGAIQTTSDGSTYTDAGTYAPDEWYKVVIIRTGTNKCGYLIDSQGNAVYSSITNETVAKISAFQQAANAATTATIDNAKIVSYDTTENEPSCVNSSVDGEDGVAAPRNVSLTFEFDQEIADDSIIILTREDGEEITEVTGITTEKTLYNTLVLKYEGLLDRKTTYVLLFSEVSNGTLTCTDEITFTTEDLHIWNDISVYSVETNEENVSLTDITFEISDEYGYPSFSGSVMAVVYQDGKMLAIDMQPLTDAATNAPLEVSFDFNLDEEPSGAKISVILLDVENGPIPLAGGMYTE